MNERERAASSRAEIEAAQVEALKREYAAQVTRTDDHGRQRAATIRKELAGRGVKVEVPSAPPVRTATR